MNIIKQQKFVNELNGDLLDFWKNGSILLINILVFALQSVAMVLRSDHKFAFDSRLKSATAFHVDRAFDCTHCVIRNS